MSAQQYQYQNTYSSEYAGRPPNAKHPLKSGVQKESDTAQSQDQRNQFDEHFYTQNHPL